VRTDDTAPIPPCVMRVWVKKIILVGLLANGNFDGPEERLDGGVWWEEAGGCVFFIINKQMTRK